MRGVGEEGVQVRTEMVEMGRRREGQGGRRRKGRILGAEVAEGRNGIVGKVKNFNRG